jgi:hypothetical protein
MTKECIPMQEHKHVAARIILGTIGLVLLGAGVLYAVLGVWGVDRGGSGAWVLTLIGVAGVVAGACLLFLASRTCWRN